jgi:hypothetical protein
MRYGTAVRRLRTIAERCDRASRIWDEPVLVGGYAFGDVLDGAADLPFVQVALVLDCPAEEVTWRAMPPHGAGIAGLLDLEKAPVEWFWRPAVWPVWNHLIRGPVRFWSPTGPDEYVLDCLEQRRFADLPRLVPTGEDELAQLLVEFDAALAHLRDVDERYWDRGVAGRAQGSGLVSRGSPLARGARVPGPSRRGRSPSGGAGRLSGHG